MHQNSEIVLDSIINGERVTTFRYEIWRPLHSELLTYRQCARNASSSRAIPAHINIYRVRNEPFIPTFVGTTHKGMSPSEFVDDNTRELFVNNWKFCASEAANRAETFEMLGISKSIINRILEPYNTINVLMTGASAHWEWLFKQRTAEDAEPNLRELVLMMQEQYRAATPVDRSMHLPFIDEKDRFIQGYDHLKVSVARCARLSYTPFGEPARNTEADLKLADRLLESLHLSPFEHIVVDDRAAPDIVKWTNSDGVFYDEMFGEIIGATENAISDEVWTFRQLLGF